MILPKLLKLHHLPNLQVNRTSLKPILGRIVTCPLVAKMTVLGF